MSVAALFDSNEARVLATLLALQASYPEERLAILVNQRNEHKYSPLHVAIFFRNIDAFKTLIALGANINNKCHGNPPLHLIIRGASLPGAKEFGDKAITALLEQGANVLLKDDNGFTAVHLAAFYNFPNYLEQLLASTNRATDLVNVAPRLSGLSALQLAAMSDAVESIQVLIKFQVNLEQILPFCGSTALHTAAVYKCFRVIQYLATQHPMLLEIKDAHDRTAADILTIDNISLDEVLAGSDEMKSTFPHTAIMTSELCNNHHTCTPSTARSLSAPPENIHRIIVLNDHQFGALRSSSFTSHVHWRVEPFEAALSDILRVHEWTYIRRLEARCSTLADDVNDEENGLGLLDADTTFSKGSYRGALAAAGAGISAVDEVMSGRAKNAFCPVRPPGHHSGPLGLVASVTGADSHGFCLMNNISIAASYAMNKYREQVKKVAIVDFDVHHGNGTEETVRWLKPHVQTNTLELGNTSNNSYIAGMAVAELCIPRYKPWFSYDDSRNVLFVSVHGYGPRERGLEHLFPRAAFYPGTGKSTSIHLPTSTTGADGDDDASGSSNSGVDSGKKQAVSQVMEVDDEGEGDDDSNDNDDHNRKEKPTKKSSSNSDDDEDDDDDDEDFGEGQNDDEEEEEEEEDESVDEPTTSAVPGNSTSYTQLKKLYNTPIKASTNTTSASSTTVEPLILDVGMHLAEVEPEESDSLTAKQYKEFAYRVQWRKYFRQIFAQLDEFSPDFIFISAGFDAHKKDTINAGYISLVEEDYYWVTSNLAYLANKHSAGRIVSILEGGYQLSAEHSSAFAKSVCSHVQALNKGCMTSQTYHPSIAEEEQRREEELLEKLRKKYDEELAEAAEQEILDAQRREEMYYQQTTTEEDNNSSSVNITNEVVQQMVVETITQQQAEVPVVDVVEEEGRRGRKRARPQVDYAALDEELRKQNV